MTDTPGTLLRPGARARAPSIAETGASRHVFFLLAVSAVLMNSIDTTIVAVAVPQLTTALDAPMVWVAWTITAYQFTQIIVLPLAGKLSDSLGRRQVFLFCVALFTLGSLLCAVAPR